MNYVEKKTCRACGMQFPDGNLLDLGEQHIVDFLAEGQEGRGKAPLQLVQCVNKGCRLLQLRHTVNADTLYRTFWYRSGINEQMREALKDVVDESLQHVELKPNDLVCDIGSNDGTLLGFYPTGIRKVGFEPSAILAAESMEVDTKHLHVVADYFSGMKAMKASQGKKYKVITAIAMFYDLDNPVAFLRDVASILQDDGIFVVQMNYLGLMVRNLSFDNIGHEHLCYYSLTSLKPLFLLAGLQIVDVEINDVNGGSFRIYAKKVNGFVSEPYVNMMLQEEKEHLTAQALQHFAEKVAVTCLQLKNFIVKSAKAGKNIYAYGASTRGSTLLQTVFSGKEAARYLSGVAERDEHKIGLTTVGTGLKIVSEEEAREKADYFLILPYHFWNSIAQRERTWMLTGGKVIIPVPFPKIMAMTDTCFGAAGKFIPMAVELQKELEMMA